MSQKEGKSRKPLLIALIAAVVVLAIVLTLVLTMCGGKKDDTTATTGAAAAEDYVLYWNVDRKIYAGQSSTGMSSREPNPDTGYFQVLFAMEGRQGQRRVADRRIINKIDNMDLMGLVLDENGIIVDVQSVEEITGGFAVNKFYVESVDGNTIVTNSSNTLKGMQVELEITDKTKIYDVSGESGMVGCETTLVELDCIIAIQNKAGEITHIYAVEREPQGPTQTKYCDHCKTEVTWRAWAYDSTLPTTKSGHYYLYNDVNLTTQQSIAANVEVVLDLNGKTVNGSGAGRMYSIHNEGAYLGIMDYSAEKTGKMVGTGKINAQGGVVWVRYGKFEMWSGTLDASQLTNTLNGATVCIDGNSVCNLYGGTWIGGTAQATYNAASGTSNAGRGGTVMNFGKFTMYDGVIKGGTSKSVFNTKTNAYNGGTGGNVDNHGANAVFTMEGGTIQNGTADGYAGNIYLTSGATANINGGTVTGGQTLRAGQNGGNIASGGGCTLNITGGTIKNGITRNCGANVYTAGIFNMSGGTITGGKKLDATTGEEVGSYNKNLFVVNGTTTFTGGKITGYAELVPTTATGCIVNISGKTVIYGAAEGDVNLRVPSGTVLNVGNMKSGAKIGITGAGVISNKTSESNKQYFSVDNDPTKPISYYGGCLCIGEVLENCICGHAHTEDDPGVGDCDGEKLPWMELAGSSIPVKGNYYLTSDLYVTGQQNVINATLNLSLNGYNVYMKDTANGRILQLRTGAVVNLTNWGKTEGGLFQNTQGFKPDGDGGDCGPVVLVHNYSPDSVYYDLPVLSVYDVTMSVRDGDKVAGGVTNGGAITVYSGTMNLFEGSKVIGGKPLDSGGAINVQGGKAVLNIKGGTVTGGEAYVTKKLVDYTAETPEVSLNGSGAVNYRGGQGGNINIAEGGTVNMYEGSVVSGGKANVAGNIGIGGNCTFNMYGGTVTGGEVGNDIRNNGAHGGNIAVFGTLNLSGGLIEKGIAGNGGNISTQNTVAVINMTGGTISEGKALRVTKINEDGTPLFSGETQQFSGGTGGNIYMFHVGAKELNLNGGVIEKGYAQWDGGNMYLYSPASTTVKDYKIGAVTIRDGIGNKGANIVIHGSINMSNGAPLVEGPHTYTFEGTTIENGDGTQGGANFYIGSAAKVVLGEGTKVLGGAIRSGSKSNGGSIYLVDANTEVVLDGGIVSGGISTNCGGNFYMGGGTKLTVLDGYILNGGNRAIDWNDSTAINYTSGNANIFNVGGAVYLKGGWIDGYTEIMTSSATVATLHVSGAPKLGDISDAVCTEIGIEDKTPNEGKGVYYSAVESYPAGYVADRDYIILDDALTEGALITISDIGSEQGYPLLTGAATDRQKARDITGYEKYFVHTSGQAASYVEADAGHGEIYIGTTNCLCGHAHTEADPGVGECDGTQLFWSPWSSNNSLPDSGNYFLTCDVTVNNKAWRNKKLNLSMNGYNIKSTNNRPLQLQASADITITNWTKTTGKITGSKVDGDGGIVLMHNYYDASDASITAATLKAPKLTLYSVHIDASGVINTKNNAVDIVYGGAIYAVGNDKAAGAVPGLTEATRYVSTVKLYGDTIIENGRAKKGGNIYAATTGELIMDDNAIIRNGTAIDEGGNVRFDYKLTMSGSSSIYGGFDENQPNADHKNVAMVMVNGKTYGTHLNMSDNASIAGFISAWYGDAGNLRSYTLSGNVQIVGTKPEGAADDFVVHGFNWPAEDDLDVSGLTKNAKIMVSGNAAGYFATGVSDANKDWIAGCFEPIPSVDADIYVDGNKLFMGKQYCLCGSTTDEHVVGFCDGIKHLWQPAVNLNAIKNVDGKTDRAYYLYLTSDIAWENYQLTLDNGEDIYIDLNGYKITNGGGSRMMRTLGSNGSTLVITNTSDKASSIINTSQTIDQGGIIWGAGNNTNNVKVYNVTLDVSGGKARIYGTAIVSGNANVDLYNVIIKGGVAKAAVANDVMNQPLGGAVSVRGGKLTWNGGKLIGGEVIGGYDSAKGAPSYISGGAFYISAGSAELTNVDISGGKASYFTYNNGSADKRIDGWGGNIGIEGGTFKMTGGSVKNGFAHAGGNIYNWGGTAEFNGVTIEGGEAGWSGGSIILDKNSTNTFTKCEITGGKSVSEGGMLKTRETKSVTFTDCTLTGGICSNDASDSGNGGTINSSSFVTFDGCTITGGNAGNVAGCWQINSGADIKNCTITGGTVDGGTGASTACLFIVGGNTTIENTTISGKCEIYGSNTGTNTFKGKVTMDDLYVGPIGTKLLVVDSTFDGANSSIMLRNAGNFAGRAFASATAASQAAGFKTPADVSAGVSYVDGKLYVADTKVMCLCGETHDAAYTNCDGTKLTWLSWESKTSLPTEGNWYLTDNVTLSSQYTLRSNTLNLSLNGYSIQTNGNQRVFQLRPSSKLTLTNWGKNIGGVIRNAYGFPEGYDGPTGAIILAFDYDKKDGDVLSVINIMDVTLDASGSQRATSGGAIALTYGTLNLYKNAKVVGCNVSYGGGAIRANTTNATINVYTGASITGGSATFIPKSANVLYYHGVTFNNQVSIDGVYNGNNIEHCLCGDADGHAANDVCDGVVHSWKMWEGTTNLPTGDGYWFLPETSGEYKIGTQCQVAAGAHMHLDLNGQTLTGARIFVTFNKDSKITVTDNHTGAAAGKVVSTMKTNNYGQAAFWGRRADNATASSITVYNITVDASNVDLTGETGRHGTAFFMENMVDLNLYNVKAIGGKCATATAVKTNGGNVKMVGTTLVSGTNEKDAQSACAWFQNVAGGKTFYFKDVTVEGNMAITAVANNAWSNDAALTATVTVTGNSNIGTATGGGLAINNGSQTVNFTGLTGTVYLGGDDNHKLVADVPETLMNNLKPMNSANYYLSWEVEAATDTVGDIYYRPNTVLMNCLCGHEHTEADPGVGDCTGVQLAWYEWTSTTSLPTSGNYYLTQDVTVNNVNWKYTTVNIALNGKTIKGNTNRPIQLRQEANMTLTNWKNTTGGVNAGSACDGEGACVLMFRYEAKTEDKSANLYAYNVKFNGSTAPSVVNGGVIASNAAGSNVKLFDCDLVGTKVAGKGAAGKYYGGGCVFIAGTGANLVMNNTKLSGGSIVPVTTPSAASGKYYMGGGNLYINNGVTAVITKCEITGGQMTSTLNVDVNGGNIFSYGDVTMTNTKVTGGNGTNDSTVTDGNRGGNIEIGGGIFKATGCEIKNGHSTKQGGNVRVFNGAQATFTKCTIDAGSSDNTGENIGLFGSSTYLTLEGTYVGPRGDISGDNIFVNGGNLTMKSATDGTKTQVEMGVSVHAANSITLAGNLKIYQIALNNFCNNGGKVDMSGLTTGEIGIHVNGAYTISDNLPTTATVTWASRNSAYNVVVDGTNLKSEAV